MAFFQADFLKDMDKGAVLTHESQRADEPYPPLHPHPLIHLWEDIL